MKTILLTQGKIALVDDEDYERINQFKWYANGSHGHWYAARISYAIKTKPIMLLMHRVILNAPEGVQVDHHNGDGLYNLKENLRLCTHQENMHNRRKPNKNNKLGIKGIRWCKKFNKFDARIMINKKSIHLGLFNVMGDADSAYRIAEEKYFGEFARNAYLEVIGRGEVNYGNIIK